MRDASILIASNALADAALAADALRGEFKGVTPSCRAESALADFERCKPEVVVLAFRDLAEAERYYFTLCQASELVGAHPHRTLVLCRTEDVPRAYQQCKGGRFDDYMQFWPMTFDAYRLPMSVLHAVRHLRLARALECSATELVAHARRVAAIDPFLTQALAVGEQHVQSTSELVQQVDRRVAAVLDAAAARSEAEQHPAGPFRALQTLAGQVEALARWSSDLREQTELHLQSMRPGQEASAAANAPGSANDPAGRTVLVVEDDEFQQKILRRLVGQEDLLCEVAGTGAAAWEALQKQRPALILLDYMLPDIDGVVLLRRVRSTAALASVPVIMLTGNGDKQVVVASMQAGANDFMVKPVAAERLREKLRRFAASTA